ncbi:hypothetical protein COB21_04685 [Candidatus Aerophobetes bacterium]|uniref:Major facilitator superfamily (MFS) profile domain-containing protein n=1 Tax=Aerophobetes bacterium TaxID=2030807 RepID=A0A2A4X2A0_UNCAE|nr:MAG: hypothetical protein COB21_04685 [Candidatus Aerophobetes bacterium]
MSVQIQSLKKKISWSHPSVLPQGHWLTPWLVFIAISITNILAVMSLWAVDLGGSSIAGALLLGTTELSWVSLSYIVVSSTCVPISDWFSNRYGYKRIFFIGVLLFVIGTVCSGFATGFWSMVLARSVAGLGSAGIFPNSITLLVKVFDEKLKTLVVSLYVAMAFGVGTILGLQFSGYLLENVSWQSIFFIVIWFVPLILGFIFCFFSETEKKDLGKFDGWGVILYLAFIASLVTWIADVKAPWNTEGFSSLFSKGTLFIMITSFVGFLIRENRCKSPLIDLSLFRLPAFLNGALALFLVAICFFSTVSGFNDIFQSVLNYSKSQAGYYLMPIGIGVGLFGGLSSYLSTKFGARIVYISGMLFVIISCILNQRITIQSDHIQMGWILFLRGSGIGLALGPLTSLMLRDVSSAQLGQAAFMATLFRQMGGSLGSLGLSLIKELRKPFHLARYGEQMGQNSQNLANIGSKLDNYFVSRSGAIPAGGDFVSTSSGVNEASELSYRWLSTYGTAQAEISATNDAFLIFGLALSLITLCIVLLISKDLLYKRLFKKR